MVTSHSEVGKNPLIPNKHHLRPRVTTSEFNLSTSQVKTQNKKEETIHGLQGANPALPQGEEPPMGNSRLFFAFWDVMGNPMNGAEKNQEKIKNKKENNNEINKKNMI